MTAGPCPEAGLVHHSDRGVQYVSIKYTEHLAEAGLEAEVIHRRRPWRSMEAVEYATLEWVDWFNNRRLSNPSATSRPPRPKPTTMLNSRNRLSPRDSNQIASGVTGTVHTPHINCFGERIIIVERLPIRKGLH
jgi:putative transposase